MIPFEEKKRLESISDYYVQNNVIKKSSFGIFGFHLVLFQLSVVKPSSVIVPCGMLTSAPNE